MKNSKLIVALALFMIMPTFAQRTGAPTIGGTRVVEGPSTCVHRVNFLGLFQVWSGERVFHLEDSTGTAIPGSQWTEPCTPDGNWDWAW